MTGHGKTVKPELVFWLDAPPRSVAGTLRHVSREWGSRVYYLCVRPMGEERKSMGWEDCDHGEAVVAVLSEQPDPERFVREFVQSHLDAIHVCNGFRSLASRFFKKHLFSVPDVKIAVWSERPGVCESLAKQVVTRLGITNLMHRYYALRYGPKVRAYLPLGTLTLETFARLNWDRKVMFPFMYDSQIPAGSAGALPRKPEEPLRLLYVGRFVRATKGVDVLVASVESGLNGNWRLDLVGRHGEYEQTIIAWAKDHPKVSYLGVWPSGEVVTRIANYDVCLVPSRFDGWGLITNEAIHAGVGVIVTDAAASCDLVKASGAGMVIPAGNVNALRMALQQVIDNPGLAELWKKRAREYAPGITSESIGRYLMEVLKYTFVNPALPRPKCPWL